MLFRSGQNKAKTSESCCGLEADTTGSLMARMFSQSGGVGVGVCLKVPHLNQMLPNKEYFGMGVSGLTVNCSEKCCQWDL